MLKSRNTSWQQCAAIVWGLCPILHMFFTFFPHDLIDACTALAAEVETGMVDTPPAILRIILMSGQVPPLAAHRIRCTVDFDFD